MSDFESNVMLSLGRIEEKVDQVAAGHRDHETRLRTIETAANESRGQAVAKARLVGAFSGAAAGAAPSILTAFWKWFTGHH